MAARMSVSDMAMDHRDFGSQVLTKRHKHRTCVRCGKLQEDGERRYFISSKHPMNDYATTKYFCSKKCLVTTITEDIKKTLKTIKSWHKGK